MFIQALIAGALLYAAYSLATEDKIKKTGNQDALLQPLDPQQWLKDHHTTNDKLENIPRGKGVNSYMAQFVKIADGDKQIPRNKLQGEAAIVQESYNIQKGEFRNVEFNT